MSRPLIRPRSFALVAVLFAFFLPTLAPAQRSGRITPSVAGTIMDSVGVPLPEVQVLLVELGRVTRSNGQGQFTFRGLPAGSYHLSATLIGHKPAHAVARILESGADVAVELRMAVTPLHLETVNVTAASAGGDVKSITQSVGTLSGAALQRSVGSTLAQSLASEPGLSMRFNGTANMPVIRGLTGDRILVLQDGERSADLSSAAKDHATTIDPFAAQRVEVVRGPASLLYGNNALGGVVNVISNDIPTTVPERINGFAGALAESATPGGTTSAGVTLPLSEAWAMSLRGSAHSASSIKVGGGGTLDNTQSRYWNGMGSLGWVGKSASGGMSFANYDFNYGLPHAPDDPELVHIVGARRAIVARLAFGTSDRGVHDWKIDATAQGYHHGEFAIDGVLGTAFKLKTETMGLKARTDFGRWRGTIGAQGLFKQYSAEGDEALTPAANSNAFGAYIYQEVALTGSGARDERTVSLQMGGRFDTYAIQSKTGVAKFGPGRTVQVNSPSGSLGLSVPVGESVTLNASAALAFRAPSVEELFSNAVHAAAADYEVGNPALKVEKNEGFDGQLRWQSGRANMTLGGYFNLIQGYIYPDVSRDTIVDGTSMPLARMAQKDARLTGLEASGEFRMAAQLVAGVMGDYVQGRFRDASGPLPFMPPGRVGASIRWDNGKYNVGGDVKHGFRQANVTGGQDIATGAYTVLQLSAGLNMIVAGRAHTFTLRIDNVGDTRYFDATSRIKNFSPNPGRNAALVYKVLF